MLSLQDIKFVCNDQQDYIRRLERAYEQQQEEIKRLKGRIKDQMEELDAWREEGMI